MIWKFWGLTCEEEFQRLLSFFLRQQPVTRRHFRVWCVCYSLLLCFLPMFLAYLKTEKEINKCNNIYIIFTTSYIYLRTKLIYYAKNTKLYVIHMTIYNRSQKVQLTYWYSLQWFLPLCLRTFSTIILTHKLLCIHVIK